eukprot:scaffold451011_cov24-Prasinocladus_malaysianus.AAC.1
MDGQDPVAVRLTFVFFDSSSNRLSALALDLDKAGDGVRDSRRHWLSSVSVSLQVKLHSESLRSTDSFLVPVDN